MKFHALKPFIFQMIYALFLFIGVPCVFLLGPWIEIKITDSLGFVLIIVGIIFYTNVILFEIAPGFYALIDLLTNNFCTQKMIFIQGYADRRRLLTTKGEKKLSHEEKKKFGSCNVYEYAYFYLVFATSEGKRAFFSTFPCDLKTGECYVVRYGKYSKTIVSIGEHTGDNNTRGDG